MNEEHDASSATQGLSKRQIADLKVKHGDRLAFVEIEETGDTFVFRKPNRHEWRRYMSVALNDRRKQELDVAGEQLAVDTLVHPLNGEGPDHLRLRKLFEVLPGVGLQIVSDLQDLAGAGTVGVKTGKL